MDKQEKVKRYTLTELLKIDGAFDVGKRYKCVKTSGSFFVINKIYTCNGEGVVYDERSDLYFSYGGTTLFELVVEPKIYWNGESKPKFGETVDVDLGNRMAQGLIVYVGQSFGIEMYVVQLQNSLAIKEIRYIKPIDTRTDKEKAIDELFVDMPQSTVKKALEYAYDKWVGDKK